MSTQNPVQPRQPSGIPIGGQWAEKALASSGLTLDGAVARIDGDLFPARREQLAAGGYVPAVAAEAVVSPTTTARGDDWWDTHFVQAEYNAEDGGYAQMPDDYTPAMTSGHAMSGHRRTHRMAYSAGGVAVRMPSRTAINRFATENKGNTFDVPVSASLPSGDVQGWVRVTKVGPGRWETSGVGFTGDAEVGVAEAVGATLEGRSSAMKPQSFNDLIERRKQRIAEQGFEMSEVTSTWIESVGYDKNSGVLATLTSAGRMYGHKVPHKTFDALSQSRSPGALFNKLVKGNERTEVHRCGDCGRYTTAGAAHTCPAGHKAPTGQVDTHAQAAMARATRVAAAARPSSPTPGQPAPAPEQMPDPGSQFGPAGHIFDPDAKQMDLKQWLTDAGDRDLREPGDNGMYGDRGWTQNVAEDLQRFTSSTYNRYAYSDALSPTMPAISNGDMGIARFSGVDGQAATSLASKLPEGAGKDRQNNGPSLNVMLASAAQNPGTVELSGYVVGQDRTDERVSVDGVLIFDAELTRTEDPVAAMHAAKNVYGLVDAKRRPDEIHLVDVPWRPGQKAWRLWWD
ncbi:hypothetical protein [Pseudactinotalea sp. Z1748]|uniref:hypothetical protein n=1 Tax=Pseudactinotalea sp. Z1748 TaxID=3413027 RepID=UPI003C7C189B